MKQSLKKCLPFMLVCGTFSCGDASETNPKNDKYKQPLVLDTGIWSATSGEALPSWVIKDGRYESPCLSDILSFPLEQGGDFTGQSYFKSTLSFQGSKISRRTEYYREAGCRDPKDATTYEGWASHVHQSRETEQAPLFIYYFADSERVSVSAYEIYLDGADASLLNQYKVCQDNWTLNGWNNVLGLDREHCSQTIAAIPDRDAQAKQRADQLLLKIFPYTPHDSYGLYILARHQGDDLIVKSGSGLIFNQQEVRFKKIP